MCSFDGLDAAAAVQPRWARCAWVGGARRAPPPLLSLHGVNVRYCQRVMQRLRLSRLGTSTADNSPVARKRLV
jgi:hypothetical protein